jgi:AcrR family transcriptional regulator
MVTSTFQRLDEEKKKRLMDALIHEFSEHTFSEASINRIVKDANISRGSFYQYFTDKEDCYLYLLQVIAQEKYILFQGVVQQSPHDSVYDEYLGMLDRSILWMKEKPVYYKIGALMDLDNSDFIRNMTKLNPQMMEYFHNLIRRDQELVMIRKDIDPVTLSVMLFSITRSMLTEHFYKQDFTGMIEKARKIFAIIQTGTRPKENNHV